MTRVSSSILHCSLVVSFFLVVSFSMAYSAAAAEVLPGNELTTVGNGDLEKATLENHDGEEKVKGFRPQSMTLKKPILDVKPIPPKPLIKKLPPKAPPFKKPFPFVKKSIPKPIPYIDEHPLPTLLVSHIQGQGLNDPLWGPLPTPCPQPCPKSPWLFCWRPPYVDKNPNPNGKPLGFMFKIPKIPRIHIPFPHP